VYWLVPTWFNQVWNCTNIICILTLTHRCFGSWSHLHWFMNWMVYVRSAQFHFWKQRNKLVTTSWNCFHWSNMLIATFRSPNAGRYNGQSNHEPVFCIASAGLSTFHYYCNLFSSNTHARHLQHLFLWFFMK